MAEISRRGILGLFGLAAAAPVVKALPEATPVFAHKEVSIGFTETMTSTIRGHSGYDMAKHYRGVSDIVASHNALLNRLKDAGKIVEVDGTDWDDDDDDA